MKIDNEKAIQLWERGLLDKEIAQELGCIPNSVSYWRKRNDLPSNVGIFAWDSGGYVDDHKRSYVKYGI